ncbi:hypothetical protein M3Y99_00089700 [Aphelenchoides fujianensis]|nr:hypothetical protein M3Y99_00089700 [Aphelenchoides fujianensis]
MFKYSLNGRPRIPLGVATRRLLSAQQAASYLRPFFFAVHPDRFARIPEARKQNEKSLQIFNGYLNEMFPRPHRVQRPTKVKFSIMRKEDEELEEIALELSGHDPVRIIKMALERCKLDSDHLPAGEKPPPGSPSPTASTSDKWPTAENLWQELRKKESRRRPLKKSASFTNGRILLQNLIKNREDALEKRRVYERTREFLNDEVDYVKRLTGVKKIHWTINWENSYMRRCLVNVQQILKLADADTRESIIHALNGHTLIFGRGSFVCCDGSIQFGADDVPEAWEKVCFESTVRRFELQNLSRLIERVQDLLGGAELKIDHHSNLLQTTHQLQSVIVRISSRPRADRERVKELATGVGVEILNSYSDISMTSDGRIQIPCNVDVRALIEFLEDHRQLCTEMRKNTIRQKVKLDEHASHCRKLLDLEALTWDPEISAEKLIVCMERLEKADESIRNQLQGLEVRISTSSIVYTRPDGALSIPVDFRL